MSSFSLSVHVGSNLSTILYPSPHSRRYSSVVRAAYDCHFGANVQIFGRKLGEKTEKTFSAFRSASGDSRQYPFRVPRGGLLDFLAPKGTSSNSSKSKQKQREELKSVLLSAIQPLERGVKASEDEKRFVEKAVRQLEDLSPTTSPLESPLLNGKWKLVYTTSETILGTNKPSFLRPSGPIYQSIDTETLQALNQETWPFYNQVQATLTPTSKSSVDVKFDIFRIFSLINVKAPDSFKGDLTITYLDEDMRISRGNRGNIFVLVMEDPSFRIGVELL